MVRRAMSGSPLTDEDGHAEQARRTILGIDPDRFSVLTGTDSTESSRTGAGKTLDGWLSRGGHLVETVVTAAASHMGAGPTDEMHGSPTEESGNELDQDVVYNSNSSDVTLTQQRQNPPERAQEPVRRTIIGIDPDIFSIPTGTGSTMSNLTGAGRILGGWLSLGGRFVDAAVTAAASRVGAGPTPLFKRLLIPQTLTILAAECRCGEFLRPHSNVWKVIRPANLNKVPTEARSGTGGRQSEGETSLRMMINFKARIWCDHCRGMYAQAAAAVPSFTEDCHGMIQFIRRSANPTSRELALFYIHLLWYLNPGFKRAIVSLGLDSQLSLLDRPVSLVSGLFSTQFGWLVNELQSLINDESLRSDRPAHDHHPGQRTSDAGLQDVGRWTTGRRTKGRSTKGRSTKGRSTKGRQMPDDRTSDVGRWTSDESTLYGGTSEVVRWPSDESTLYEGTLDERTSDVERKHVQRWSRGRRTKAQRRKGRAAPLAHRMDPRFEEFPQHIQPVDDSEADFLVRLFDGLATATYPCQHDCLISGLLRFSMSRIFQSQMDPAALRSLLKARLQQRPQDYLGHIDFPPTPPKAMYMPDPIGRCGMSEKLLRDYFSLCSDANVGECNMLGLMTKILSESLELRLVDWIRSFLPHLQAEISSQTQRIIVGVYV